jgi:hypothetical protein
VEREMFRDREQMRRRLEWIVERFRQKGATSPEKAMTIQQLGLPPRFEEAMHRRLGQSGIFVEVSGMYYLNEERLRQIQEQRAKAGYGSSGGSGRSREGPPTWSRVIGIVLMLPIGIIIVLVLFYFIAIKGGLFPGELLIVLMIIFLALSIARLLFWRSRRRYWREHWGDSEKPTRSLSLLSWECELTELSWWRQHLSKAEMNPVR